MAALAGKIVAGEAERGIGGALADVARGVDDQVPAVADEIVIGALPELGDVGRVPIGYLAPAHTARAKTSTSRNGEHDDQEECLQHGWNPMAAAGQRTHIVESHQV